MTFGIRRLYRMQRKKKIKRKAGGFLFGGFKFAERTGECGAAMQLSRVYRHHLTAGIVRSAHPARAHFHLPV